MQQLICTFILYSSNVWLLYISIMLRKNIQNKDSNALLEAFSLLLYTIYITHWSFGPCVYEVMEFYKLNSNSELIWEMYLVHHKGFRFGVARPKVYSGLLNNDHVWNSLLKVSHFVTMHQGCFATKNRFFYRPSKYNFEILEPPL